MPTLTFKELEIGALFAAVKVRPAGVIWEREGVASKACIWQKTSETMARKLLCFNPSIWSKVEIRFDADYHLVQLIPG